MSRRKELAETLRSEAESMDTTASEHMFPDTRRSEAVDLREAADLLDQQEDDSTVEVRILVRVDMFEGEPRCAAAAYHGATDDDLHDRVYHDSEDYWTDDPRFSWVLARVPKPERSEVEGMVDS